MSFANLLSTTNNRINTISINRPEKLNALNIDTLNELDQAIKLAVSDSDIRLIIIRGVGEKAFVAGADIKELAHLSMEKGFELSESIHKIFSETIEGCPKPIIAAINGYALGGGLEVALACHIRVATTNAKMGLPEVSLGLIPGYGGTQRLTRLIGKGRALDMIMTGRMIGADEALNFGLANYKIDQENLNSFTVELANKILMNSSNAIKHAIKSVNAYDQPGCDGFKVEMNEFSKCFQTKDFVEGTSAFLEKRKPNFN